MRYLSTRLACIVAAPFFLLAACGGEDGQRTGSVSRQSAEQARSHLSLEVAAHLDSGNQAYRATDYEKAREHYRAATRLDSDATSAWFGVYMAEKALGNQEAARWALERAGSLSDEAPMLHGEPSTESESDTGGDDRDGAP